MAEPKAGPRGEQGPQHRNVKFEFTEADQVSIAELRAKGMRFEEIKVGKRVLLIPEQEAGRGV